MSNTFLTNSFLGGMNMDTDVMLLPAEQYRYAENVRIITDSDGNTGVLLNIQNKVIVEGGLFIGDKEVVLATTTINQYGIIMTVEDDITRIYRIQYTDSGTLEHTVILKGDLYYTKYSSIRLVANYESDSNIKLYFTDGQSSIRTLNIMSDRYIQNEGGTNTSVDLDGNILNPGSLDISPSTLLPAPEIVSLGTSGNLTSGMVQYCYLLFNVRGSNTGYSPCSNVIHLTTSEQGEAMYSGSGKGVNSNKSVNLKINLEPIVKGLFDQCRIIRIKYEDYTDIPVIDVIDEIELPDSGMSISYLDTGNKSINTLTVEQLNGSATNNLFTAATIEKKDNILFAADIRELTWKPDYDARSYRFTKDNKLILNSSDINQNIEVSVNDSNLEQVLKEIPKNHDCINPFNLNDYNINEGVNNKPSKYRFKKDGENNILGGTGINIDYQFINLELHPDVSWNDHRCTAQLFRVTSLGIKNLNGEKLDELKFPDYSLRNVDYSDPYIASKVRGYQRDEIYRFGIVFYNEKNVVTPVYWIADIKFPHSMENCPWYFTIWSNTGEITTATTGELTAKVMGVQFDIKNFPQGAIAYEIVRCKRTKDDRTVLMLGALSSTTQFDHRVAAVGDWVKGSQSLYPTFPLGVCYDWYVTARMATALGAIGFTDILSMDPSKIIRNNYIFISPEIDVATDNTLVTDMENSYIDMSHYFETRFPDAVITRGSVSVKGIKYFYSPIESYRARTTNAASLYIIYGSRIENDDRKPLLLASVGKFSSNSETSYADLVTNLIAKRYIPHFTGLSDRYLTDITASLDPPVMLNSQLSSVGSFYRPINNRSYVNIGLSFNNLEQLDWPNAKIGYFGKCAVISTSRNIPASTGIDNTLLGSSNVRKLIDSYNSCPFTLPIVNIKRRIVPYGGNSNNSRTNSTYISTNSYTLIEDSTKKTNYVFGGDTYLGILDHRTISPIDDNTGGAEEGKIVEMSMSDYIPVETTINLNLMYGDSMSKQRTYTLPNPYLATTASGGTTGYILQSKDYYAYNDAYSVQADAKLYAVDSSTSISNLKEPYKVMYSEMKTSNEVTDSWAQFKPANYLNVDSLYGPITNIRSFAGKLFFWLDSALGVLSVNDRSLILDNNVGALTLGTGGVLDRYDYISTNNGSSISNDPSIVMSDLALYWYDTDKNEICMFSDIVHKLSKEKNVQTFLNNNANAKVLTSIYDNKYNEILMCFNAASIVYNEYTQTFTSFYTFNPVLHIKYSDKLLYIYNNNIMESSNNSLEPLLSKIQFVINKDPLVTKTYDNVFFGGKFNDIKSMLKNALFTTKTQIGTILEDYINGGYAIDYREDTYRFAIGRELQHADSTSYPGRLKGKYMICNYTLLSDSTHNFNIPNINTTYRYSLV